MNKYQNIEKNILLGLICSLASVLYASLGFSIGLEILFASPLLAVFNIVLLKSSDKNNHTQKSISAAVSLPIAIIFSGGLLSRMFKLINPHYVREYSGPNAGDSFGLVFVWIPSAIFIMLISIGISKLISGKKKNNCN